MSTIRFLNYPRLLPPFLLAAAFLLVGNALYIHAKALLAQVLIARAWDRSLASPDEVFKPWRWADTSPVLLLQWQDADARTNELYVLDGANGSVLAFAPGLLSEMSKNRFGLKVIAGHRDTHFAFLEHVKAGDMVKVQDKSGQWREYVVSETTIADTTNSSLYVDPSVDALLLITCYPFHAVNPGGPLRYLVKAYPV
jgi:sortase A